MFTLEASFAGASKGKLVGQHFSLGDLENIGKSVVKALYYARNIEANKKMLRELFLEADSMLVNEDGDSDSSSSEDEDEKIAESDKIKKAVEEITSLEK